ncbi:MAG: phosphoribosylamine--glycine ligase [Bradymonadia bacterium]|jgi:phosphoribosylamine--glycine ligase
MNVLIIGGGGREHAIAWKVAESPLASRVYVAPGNPGTAADSRLTNLEAGASHAEIVATCQSREIDLVVVGPEAPLVAGLADALRDAGIGTVGPGTRGAELEGSKAFAKQIMQSAGVPTARYEMVATEAEVNAFVDAFEGEGLVVKADGLAAGKGVVVCDNKEAARRAAVEMLRDQPYGDASARLVLEERLQGPETSFIVLTDGDDFAILPTSQDHKRLLDGDLGPNTGGMGAYTPAPFVDHALEQEICRTVIEPTLAELRKRGIAFRGFLYAGLMLTQGGPKVLEFNVRLGDPETQALMMALDGDLLPVLQEVASGTVQRRALRGQASAVVVLAAEGYPTAPVKGAVIEGLAQASRHDHTVVFHAGTATRGDDVVVNGGRVLGVTARATTPEEALTRAYAAAAGITWDGCQRRGDIGKALASTSRTTP